MKERDFINKYTMVGPSRRHIIENRYLSIRPISITELTEEYLFWLNDISINQYLEVRHKVSTFESVIGYINHSRSMVGCEFFAIFTKNGNTHIGNINISNFNTHVGFAQYGMMIGNVKGQQMGLGGIASIMLVEYLFNDPSVKKIECSSMAANEKSWKTIESMGFLREGTLRKHDILTSGDLVDTYLYGLFPEEWEQKKLKYAGPLKDFRIVEF